MPILQPGVIYSHDIPEVALDISPEFFDISRPDAVLFNRIPVGNPLHNKAHEWFDDMLMPISATLSQSYTAGSTTMRFDNGAFVREGSVLKIGRSIYRITSANAKAKTATVHVLQNDTNHAVGATAEIIGNAQVEGKKFENTASIRRVKRKNYTQIFNESAEVTGTMEYIALVNGQRGVLAEELSKKLEYTYAQQGRAVWNGFPMESPDPETAGMMGGVNYFISTYGYSPSPSSFSEKNIDTFLAHLVNLGATIPQIWCNPIVARRFADLMDEKVRVAREDGAVGRYIHKYLSGIGAELEIVADPSCLTTSGFYVFNANNVFYRVLRPVRVEDIAKDGDSTKKLITTEVSLEVRNSHTFGFFAIAS